MKIVTFNVRMEHVKDGPYRFENRKNDIVRKIREEQPSVICFQEVWPAMYDFLEEKLPEYVFVGHGRDVDHRGEGVPIAFCRKSFAMKSMECFWLSHTPQIPGSRYPEDQGQCPRICVILTLYSREDKRCFRIVNTHLDVDGVLARKQGLELIINRLKTLEKEADYPVMVMGDFNSTPEEEAIRAMTQNKEFYDVTTNMPCTFHGYHTTEKKIDYIFSTHNLRCSDCHIWEDYPGGIYLSDHYPVSCECAFL